MPYHVRLIDVISGDGAHPHIAYAVRIRLHQHRPGFSVLVQHFKRGRCGVDDHVIDNPVRGMTLDGSKMIRGGESVGLSGLGHYVANIDFLRLGFL